jgi:hypothetical protein
MKKIIFLLVVTSIAVTACNNGSSTKPATTVTNNTEQLYACSMHPEETGKKGDKCSKCGMELTVPAKEKATDSSTKNK